MYPTAILNLIVWAAQAAPAFGATVQTWSVSAASILIGSLWQGALVAAGLALCLRLAPAIPARLRYGVWAAGFAALACLPFLPALIHWLAPAGFNSAPAHAFGMAASGTASGSPSHPLLALDARWSLGLAALWLAASLLRAASLATNAVRMRRLWRSASPVAANNLDASFRSAAARTAAPSFRRSLAKGWDALSLSLGRINVAFRAPAELCATSDLDRPCVIGFFRPRILIPGWLLERLTPAELEQVVLHESEHLRRMDDWTNLLQKLSLVLFPLNPALWWLERRLCAEREMACDDAVVSRTQAPRAYAACLAGLAERGLKRRQAALSLGAWQRRPELAERVHRLLRHTPVLSPTASAVSVALVGCGLVAGTLTLARSPQLVAFVAPVNQTSNTLNAAARSIQPSIQGDVRTDFVRSPIAFTGSNGQPYRVVKTMAILPSARTAALSRSDIATQPKVSSSQPDQSTQTNELTNSGHSLATLVPTAIAAGMKAQQASTPVAQKASHSATQATQTSANQASSNQINSPQTGWIVLTTYEEVQTIGSDEAVQGDAVIPEAHASAANTDAKASTSISITRLVLHFVQPASNVSSTLTGLPASDNPSTPDAQPASNPTQRIAIPYRDGWFVIQL